MSVLQKLTEGIVEDPFREKVLLYLKSGKLPDFLRVSKMIAKDRVWPVY
jgi:hypothetical protein